MTDQKKKSIEFKDAIQQLEEINIWFQSEDIDLDDGLQKFRQGMELIRACKAKLKDVENEFEEIKKEFTSEEETPKEIMKKEKELLPDEEVADLPF